MKEKFLHYIKDNKNYTEPFGPSRNVREEFRGHGGGMYGGMRHYRGGRRRGNYRNIGTGYGGSYPYYSTYGVDNACTQLNKDPYSTGNEIQCCNNLIPCYRDWDDNGSPYYLCRDTC